jgi:ubiquinone/menaquinone biosynthesis C-methylase UbiE
MASDDETGMCSPSRPRPLWRLLQWVRGTPTAVADTNEALAGPATLSEFQRIKASWEALGEHDPLWAIVSAPGKRGNRWDRDEFFATGVVEVRHVLNMLEEIGLEVARGRALDFGAGVGRLTQALAAHFDEVDGVDISAPMLAQANAFNRHGDRVRYVPGEADRVPFPDASFDFILSRIVLQHVGIELQRGYLREFVRVLKPEGLAVFQVPARAVGSDATQFRSPIDTLDSSVTVDMNIFPRADVERTIHDAGGRVLHARADFSAGDAFESLIYVVAHRHAHVGC